jgi:hypothetical protein
VVVSAGEEKVTVPVTLAIRQDVSLTAGIKDGVLGVEK